MQTVPFPSRALLVCERLAANPAKLSRGPDKTRNRVSIAPYSAHVKERRPLFCHFGRSQVLLALPEFLWFKHVQTGPACTAKGVSSRYTKPLRLTSAAFSIIIPQGRP